MVNFWDSSALVPLVVPEKNSLALLDFKESSEMIFTWTLAPVEVLSAFYRLLRTKEISPETHQNAAITWKAVEDALELINETESVKAKAKRILNLHPLKAADALQLAAALAAASDNPPDHTFVSLDNSLRTAAQKEGFQIFPQP